MILLPVCVLNYNVIPVAYRFLTMVNGNREYSDNTGLTRPMDEY